MLFAFFLLGTCISIFTDVHILQENLSYHVKCSNLFEDTSFGEKKAIDQVIWEVAVQLNKNHICENELKFNCMLMNFKFKFSNFRYWI